MASVSTAGTVNGVSAGSTTIIATVDGKSGSARIDVHNPVPVLQYIAPDTVVAGSSHNTSVTIIASSLVPESVLEWNGQARTSASRTDTSISIDLTPEELRDAASHTIRIVNPGPGGGGSDSTVFVVKQAPVHRITIKRTGQSSFVAGEFFILDADTEDEFGNPLPNRTIVWSSTDPSLLLVDSHTGRATVQERNDLLEAREVGIVAESEGEADTALVTVRPGKLLGPSGGDMRAKHLRLHAPNGSISTNTALSIEALHEPLDTDSLLPGTAVKIGPSTPALTGAVTIEMTWPANVGGSPERFAIHRWDGTRWVALENRSIDLDARTVSGTTQELGDFAILSLPEDEVATRPEEILYLTNDHNTIMAVHPVTMKQRVILQGNSFEHPSWSDDGKFITYTQRIAGHTAIFVIDSKGNNNRRVLTWPYSDRYPRFSADGRIFFTRQIKDFGTDYKIFSVPFSGGTATQHTFSTSGNLPADHHPSVSPNGLRIALTRSPAHTIFTTDMDGANPKSVSRMGGRNAVWSPDGQHIAYVDEFSINVSYIVVSRDDGSDVRRIVEVDNTHFRLSRVSWSDDGSKLVYDLGTYPPIGALIFQLYTINPDGSDRRQLTNFPTGALSPSWSRN